jgi:hypothetical protein
LAGLNGLGERIVDALSDSVEDIPVRILNEEMPEGPPLSPVLLR